MTRTAQLVYDSAREGVLLGVRSGLGADRVLLFRAPGVAIDVMLPASGRDLPYLHGQVTDERQAAPVEGLSVRLVGDAAAVTETDAFGQFALGLGFGPGPGEGACLVRVAGRGETIDCIIPGPGPAGGA